MEKINLQPGDNVLAECIGTYLGFTVGNVYEANVQRIYSDHVLSLVFDCDDDGDDRYVAATLAEEGNESQKFSIVEHNGFVIKDY
ncbi:hypothetical protein [Escherichia coli]|uniref:hypothetical protein n=1 Tax=Escherichia coli TaxID=562 RepID=UPI000CFBDA9C|nr:hypothetical protein [Escherichia coli]